MHMHITNTSDRDITITRKSTLTAEAGDSFSVTERVAGLVQCQEKHLKKWRKEDSIVRNLWGRSFWLRLTVGVIGRSYLFLPRHRDMQARTTCMKVVSSRICEEYGEWGVSHFCIFGTQPSWSSQVLKKRSDCNLCTS